jgi:hypothetical protein
MLVGNCVGLGSSSLIALIGSYFQPEHYDWLETRAINSRKEQPITEEAVNEANQAATIDSKAEKLGAKASARPASPRDSFDRNAMAFEEGSELVSVEVAELRKAFKLAGVCSGVVIMVTDGRCSLELDHPLPDSRDHCAPLAVWQRLRVQRTQLHCLGLVFHRLALRRLFLHPLRTDLGGMSPSSMFCAQRLTRRLVPTRPQAHLQGHMARRGFLSIAYCCLIRLGRSPAGAKACSVPRPCSEADHNVNLLSR